MSGRRQKSGSQGRVTPKAGATSPRRRRPGPDEPVQVGRRPSTPGFLLLVGIMWVGVGVIILLTMSWSWRLVPAILSFGIGLLFLRGAGSTVIRRDQRQREKP